MDVESLAVTKIQSMVARCSHLKEYIEKNDKTPFTDGHIDLYGGIGQTKEDFIGRVSVQVKGRTRGGKLAEELTFRIDRTDLRGFQKESGVLYFYVAVDRQGSRRAPYYAILSPFAIEEYLRREPVAQTEVPVKFKKLRNDPQMIEQILWLALKTRDQNPSLGFDPDLFDKMQSLTIHTLGDISFEEPVILRPGKLDYAVELVTEGGMRVPLDGELRVLPRAYAEQPLDTSIAAGGVTFTEATRQKLDSQSVMLRLAPGLSLTLTESTEQRIWNFAFSAEGTFAERLRSAQFIEGFLEQGVVEVDGTQTQLGVISESSGTDIDEVRQQIDLVRLMDELFKHLAIDGALVDLDAADDEQIQSIQTLHGALVQGKSVSNPDGEVSRGLFSIGRGVVMLIITEGDRPGQWRFINPFDPLTPHMLRWQPDGDESTKAHPVTAYDVVDKSELPRILNLRLDSIVRAYDAIVEDEHTKTLANHQVLALIGAADESPTRRSEFLAAAQDLNDWVIAQEGELPIHRVNRWQIRWRIDALSSADLEEIRALRRTVVGVSTPRAAEIELACALLIGDVAEAEFLIGRLSDEKTEEMEAWPIWRLRDQRADRDTSLPKLEAGQQLGLADT